MLGTLLFPDFTGKFRYPGNGIWECRPLTHTMIPNKTKPRVQIYLSRNFRVADNLHQKYWMVITIFQTNNPVGGWVFGCRCSGLSQIKCHATPAAQHAKCINQAAADFAKKCFFAKFLYFLAKRRNSLHCVISCLLFFFIYRTSPSPIYPDIRGPVQVFK